MQPAAAAATVVETRECQHKAPKGTSRHKGPSSTHTVACSHRCVYMRQPEKHMQSPGGAASKERYGTTSSSWISMHRESDCQPAKESRRPTGMLRQHAPGHPKVPERFGPRHKNGASVAAQHEACRVHVGARRTRQRSRKGARWCGMQDR